MLKFIKILIIVFIILSLSGVGTIFVLQKITTYSIQQEKIAQNQQIQQMIEDRIAQNLNGEDADPFGDDDIVKILFIGLDNRIGQTNGHCDAIQLIEINRLKQKVTITAVPRGTYSPLPGSGHLPTDYYVSKSCEVGGIDYGIKQIEKILGQKADYVILLGFSEAMGIFRQLDLPANDTMQWLRHRQSYKIGEPQRARNHSTFIKQMMTKFSDQLDSKFTLPAEYIIFKMIKTDLSFNQSITIAKKLAKMDLANQPQNIQLSMRPAYEVQDIAYNPENLNEKLDSLIKPISKLLSKDAYSGESQQNIQQKILNSIEQGLADPEFVRWAFDNYLWLQIDDEEQRENAHYQILTKYISLLEDKNQQEQVITDYIIEMENLAKYEWAKKGLDFLKEKT